MTCPRCGKEEHEAGRETDACVAELVMGWRRGPIFFDGVEKEALHHPTTFREYNQFPRYSTNIADAWEVVEKLKSHPDTVLFSCSRKSALRDTLIWSVIFREVLGKQHDYYAEADTLSLAICRAALKAVFNA